MLSLAPSFQIKGENGWKKSIAYHLQLLNKVMVKNVASVTPELQLTMVRESFQTLGHAACKVQ